jgi:hypothetical protein
MKRVIDRKTYNTETAEEIATNDYSDGTDAYNCGRTSSLFLTKKGAYFESHSTCWQGESDVLIPVTVEGAIEFFETAYDQKKEFEDAFPGVEIEDA